MDGEDTSRTVSRVNLPKIPSVYLSLMSFTVLSRSFLSSFRPLATGSCPSLGVRRSGTRRERRGKGHGRWCGDDMVRPYKDNRDLYDKDL